MTGTFGGALEARGIPAGEGYLESDTVGDIGKDGRVLIIRRIHVTYKLKIDPGLRAEKQDAIDRAMEAHHDACPVYRSISAAIPITASLEYA